MWDYIRNQNTSTMEAKKNPKHDLHRQSLKFFFIGLCISVTLVITAFEWSTIKKKIPSPNTDQPMEAMIDVLPTVHEIEKPIQALKPIIIKSTSPVTFSKLTEASVNEPEDTHPEIENNEPITTSDLPIEEFEDPVLFPEVQAIPVGGYESFYDQLSKSLNYPKQAQRNQIAGKVFVEFIVDKTGAVSNLKILKGIGGGCDEEALRVLAQTRYCKIR